MSEPTSAALAGRERVRTDRPDWAASHPPAHRRPLPLIAAEAVARPGAHAAADRLAGRSAAWRQGHWPPEMAELRERASAIRRETLANIETHLDTLTTSVQRNGGSVHRAKTGEQAADIVRRIAEERGVRLVVKSKSMVTEEIDLNARLEAAGMSVVETDLGEYIIQLGDERPAHIIAPAVHLSRDDVGDRFARLEGREPDEHPDPVAMAGFARERLRTDFRRADMGVTGVNFAVADTGTLVLVTNEGNADLVTSQPRVHVAVMTIEKVLPRFTDLGVLVPLLTFAGMHQEVTAYQTMLTGPRRDGEQDGPEELHLVIVDNGRRDILGTRYSEVLACIRCGACQTACPVFRTLGGGHAYGGVYGGPIGAVLTPLLSGRPEDRQLPYLSSLCGACGDVCPVKIPLPDMLVDLRADAVAAGTGAKAATSRAAWRLWAASWRSPRAFRAQVALARLVRRAVPDRLLARVPGMPRAWARGRALPDTNGKPR